MQKVGLSNLSEVTKLKLMPLCRTSSPTTGGRCCAAPTRPPPCPGPPRTGRPSSPCSTGGRRKKSRPIHQHVLILVFLIAATARSVSKCGENDIIGFLHWKLFVTGMDLMAPSWRGTSSGSATRCGRGGGWRELPSPSGSSPPRGRPRRSSPFRLGKSILRPLLV